jgi:F-type H+-transporting ATPase subunit gamma
MASMRDIKRRKNSVTSTQQITKAMKLVSTVKLQKARTRAEKTNPYTDKMYKTVCSMLKKSGNIIHPYLTAGESERKAVIVITSNRGLAGGYNSNVIKTVTGSDLKAEDLVLYTVGNKGRDYFQRRNYHIEKEYNEVIENPMFSDAREICNEVLSKYA